LFEEFGRFCWGFWRRRGAERGFFVVSLWWIAGKSWFVDGHFLGAEDFPSFLDLFFGIPILGMVGQQGLDRTSMGVVVALVVDHPNLSDH
jgi:hypothetical protein